MFQDEPLPIANAHALHGVPPPSVAPAEAQAPAKTPAAPAAVSQTKEDALNHAETKVDENKLQVRCIILINCRVSLFVL